MLLSAFGNPQAKKVWWILFWVFVPLTLVLRFHFLNNPILDVHPIRQTQTALTTYHMALDQVGFLDYRSPANPKLWDFVFELPVYQWCSAQMMKMGFSLEASSRLVNIAFFYGCATLFAWLLWQLLGISYAVWGGLFFVISPYTVVFSRAALIDWTALLFSLGMVALFVAAWRRPHPLLLVAFALAGGVCGMVKITAWYLPAFLCGLYTLRAALKREISVRRFLLLGVALTFQLAMTLAWSKWAEQVRGAKSSYYNGWLFGNFGIRFQWWRYKVIFGSFLSRWVLGDYLCVPFLVGLLSPKRHREVVWASAASLVTGTLVFFNVQTYHDYYLIVLLPFIFVIVSVGAVRLWELQGKGKWALVSLMAVLFAHHVVKLPVTYAGLFYDFRPQLADAFQLKEYTDPKDVILYTDEQTQSWHIPLYSERLATPILPLDMKQFRFSVVRFFPGHEHWDLFPDQTEFWLDGDLKGIWFVRLFPVGDRKVDPFQQLAVFKEKPASTQKLAFGEQHLSTCGKDLPQAFALPQGAKTLSLMMENKKISLPPLPFLSLPPQSHFGCEFNVVVS